VSSTIWTKERLPRRFERAVRFLEPFLMKD
jgi:hypothetical protein